MINEILKVSKNMFLKNFLKIWGRVKFKLCCNFYSDQHTCASWMCTGKGPGTT